MQNKVKAILIVIGISPFPEIRYRLCLRKRFHERVLPAFYVRDCRGKPTAPARTCNGKPDRLRERPKNIPTTYHGLALLSIFTRHSFYSSSKAMVLARNRPITNFAPCSISLSFVCMNPSPVVKRSSINRTHLSLIYSG